MSTYHEHNASVAAAKSLDLGTTASKALIAALMLALSVIAFSLFQVGSSLAKQACVDEAVGRYPGVPVSAYASATSTAMKLSFVVERQKALDSCS